MTVGAIEEFSSKYKGSQEEIDDVKAEYMKHKGDFAKIMESIMLAEECDEERIAGIIDSLIKKGEVKSLAKYQSTSEKALKTKSRKRKAKGSTKDTSLEDDSLVLAIQSKKRTSSSASAMSSILAKYGEDDLGEEDISDEAFAAAQARVTSKKNSNNKKKKGSK